MAGKDFEERMLTTEEVAKWLGIAQRTVCTWAECEELPAIKVGRQWRFRRQELLTWLERSRPLDAGNRERPAASAATAASAAYKFPKAGL